MKVIILIISIMVTTVSCGERKEKISNVELAEFYANQNNDRQALQLITTEIESKPNTAEPYILLGDINSKLGYAQNAAKNYKIAIDKGCKSEVCKLGYLDALINNKQFDLAQSAIDEFQLIPSDKLQLMKIKMEAYKGNSFAPALVKLKSMKSPEAQSLSLRLMFDNKDYVGIMSSQKSQSDKNYSSDDLLIYSKTNYIFKKYEQAEKDVTRARLLDKTNVISPRKIEAVELLVKIKIAQNMFAEAEAIYDAFFQANKQTGYVAYNKAVKSLKNSNYKQALSEIKKLAEANPTHLQSNTVLALASYAMRDYSGVLSALEPFKGKLSLSSKSLLAKAYNATGRYNEAVELIGDNPVDNNLLIDLAKAKLFLGKRQIAMSLIEKVKPDANDIIANEFLAEILYILEQDERLLKFFTGIQKTSSRTNFFVVNSYLRRKNEKQALAFASGLTDEVQKNELLAYLYSRLDRHKDAIQSLKYLSNNRGNVDDYLRLAKEYLSVNEVTLSREMVVKAIELNSGSLKLAKLVAEILQKDSSGGTLKWLNKIKVEDVFYLDAQLLLATNEIQNNSPNKAIARLDKVKNKNDFRVWLLLANANISNKNEFKKNIEKSLEAKFTIKAANILYQIYMSSNDLENVTAILTKMEQSLPLNKQTAPMMARGYLKVGELEKARYLAQVMDKSGMSSISAEILGDIDVINKKLVSALKHYKNSIKAKVTDKLLIKYYKVKFSTAKEQGVSNNELLSEVEEWLRKKPEYHSLRYFLALRYLKLSNDKSLEHFSALTAPLQNNSDFLNNYAWALLQFSHNAESLVYSKKAYKMKPRHIDIIDTYALSLHRNDKTKEARKVLKKGLGGDNENNTVLLKRLADIEAES